MILETEQSNSGSPCHRSSSILDSPTLARVERAQLRLEAGNIRNDSLERGILDPKNAMLSGRLPVETMTGPIKRGVLWQQRDRLFSRWKERYFILTQDYLQCYKKASGPANERISDMGQFMFQIKLVDVEKVDWINRRSYSIIRMDVRREGAFLFRCDDGLEDWFEYLEECSIASKERRFALKVMQRPKSRASIASPMSHVLHQSYYLFDSVPNLSDTNDENHNGISTNHSTPQKIPYSNNLNLARYSHGCVNRTNSYSTDIFSSPRRMLIHNNSVNNNIFNEEDNPDDDEVELRRPNLLRSSGNESETDWMYRKPLAPTPDNRHSVQTTDLDYSSNSTGLSTPPSTYYRPSSYRDVSSSRRTSFGSMAGSFRDKHLRHLANLNALKGSQYSEANCKQKIRTDNELI